MELKVDQNILDLQGEVMKDPGGIQVTFRTVIINALLGGSDGMAGKDKLLRFLLAERVQKPGATDLSVEEAALIKQCVGDAFSPIVVGRVWSAIDGGSDG